jgi:single-strand DNA-binding protein
MSDGFNKCFLLGNICADPTFRNTQGGTAVLNIRLATNESYLDKDKVRRERTDYHNVVIFGRRAEALQRILAKGASVFVEGSLRTSSYDDRDGNKRYKTEVHVSEIILSGRAQSQAEPQAPQSGVQQRPGTPSESPGYEGGADYDDPPF